MKLTSVADTLDNLNVFVSIYRSKKSEDQRPKVLVSQAGNFREAAVVAAPII